MKVKLSQLKRALREAFEKHQEDVDRLRRAQDGRGETEFEEDVDRLRRAQDGRGETEFEEDVDRLRRAQDGRGETEFEEGNLTFNPMDDEENGKSHAVPSEIDLGDTGGGAPGSLAAAYDPVTDQRLTTEDELSEVSPPSDKAEEFIKKNKKSFQKRYGARWKEVLYSTAWKKFGKK
jgi:hypothetical protein